MIDLSKTFRFESASNPPAEECDYIGFHPDKGFVLYRLY